MTYEILNPSFSEINRVVMGNDKVLMRCSTSSLKDYDFLETGIKYFPTKYGFSDVVLLDFLTGEDKSMIGTNLEGIEKYLVTLFPTLRKEEQIVGNFVEYFSTYQTQENELFCIRVPEGYKKVEMYEVGAEKVMEVSFTDEESKEDRLLYMITTYKDENRVVVNLSYTAYQIDKNPNRKMSGVVLRNDSLVPRWKGIREGETGLIFSEVSGSLIGTSKVSSRPIYELIKNRIGTEWNPRVIYSREDKVRIGDTEYRSLESGNKGNHPFYTRYWVKV